MAQPSNTFDAYDSVGNREDLSDLIFNISPTDTPFLSACGKTKAANTYHEWQTDALAAVSDNKEVEGDDAAGDAVSATTRLGNYTQISSKTTVLSGTLEAVNRAGRKREMAYQLAKRGKELKRDMENALVGLNNAKAAGNASTARELASVQSWIATNTSKSSGATAGVDPTGDGTDARTDGTQRALTEAMLTDVIDAIWTAGGTPDVMYCGTHVKGVINGFTGRASTNYQLVNDGKSIQNAVDVYISDYGNIKVVPNRFSRARDLLILQSDMWKIATLRPMQTKELARTGDSEKRQMLIEYTLEACNEAANGIVADLATS